MSDCPLSCSAFCKNKMHHSVKVMLPLPEEQGVSKENTGCLVMVLPALLLCLPSTPIMAGQQKTSVH